MFFKLFKSDKSKSAPSDGEAAATAEPSSAGAAPSETSPDTAEPALPLGAHMDSTGATDPTSLGFKTTADLTPNDSPIGQEKAMQSIAFGAGIKGPGYHILVTGQPGTGRRTATRAKLEEVAAKAERPSDWVYVSSFDPTGGFRALKLPPGTAKPFAEKMSLALDLLADALPAAFAADDYDLKRRTIEEEFRLSREDALEALRREAESQNIALLRTPAGIAVAPVLEGKVVKTDVFNAVPEALRREVETKIAALEAEIEAILAERPDAEKERRARLAALTEQIAGRHVRAALDDIKTEYADVGGVESYLKAAARDLVRNAGGFLHGASVPSGQPSRMAAAHPRFARYLAHVMATSSAGTGAPIVHEANPTYPNLFGRVELAVASEGNSRVVRIKPGALHRANGGYLLVDAGALLESPATADALRRALESQEIRFDPPTGPVGTVGDEIPDLEPIPLSVRVVLIADAEAQRQLSASHGALRRLFKVEAVFEDSIERTKDSVEALAKLIASIVDQHGLRPLDAAAVALLVDEAAKRAGGVSQLSLAVGELIDVCREADHWADGEGRDITTRADVERALQQRRSPATETAVLARAS